MRADRRDIATPSQTAGPFFHLGLKPQSSRVTAPTPKADGIRLLVRVTDGDGQPVDDALIELWHRTETGDAAFARMSTGYDGSCQFETVRPPADTDRHAPHLNLCVFARGLLRHLHTSVYFDGDPKLASDPVLALVPGNRRDTLLARLDPSDASRWVFELRLQGSGETVFFDV